MAPDQKKKTVLARIESLWADASSVSAGPDASPSPPPLPEHALPASSPTDIVENPDRIMSRINRLMYEAEETQLAANDLTEKTKADGPSIDDLALGISLSDQDANDEIENLGSMVMAAASDGQAAEAHDFDDVKSRFEDISKLQPPHSDDGNRDNPEYAFGVAFSNLVRHVVRDYIEKDFEPVLRAAIESEINQHLNSSAGHTGSDGDGKPEESGKDG